MKKVFKFLSVIVFLLSLTLISALENSIEGIEKDGMSINWEVGESEVIFTISAKTTGWISIGLEPTKMMKDADIVIGFVKDEKVYIEDHFGYKSTRHKADVELGGSDNVKLLSGSEIDGVTTLSFSMPLDSKDRYDKVLKKGMEYTLIFAYGNKDNYRSKHKYLRKEVITL